MNFLGAAGMLFNNIFLSCKIFFFKKEANMME
jgi:hypothetical protein